MIKFADFNHNRSHRFSLIRQWDADLPTMVVIGLNPSTADENADDPTIRRCIKFAQRENCGTLIMVNLFSYRATDPKELIGRTLVDLACGGSNSKIVRRICKAVSQKNGTIICAWGVQGAMHNAEKIYRHLLRDFKLECLGHTLAGHPRHPLYVRADAPVILWEGAQT